MIPLLSTGRWLCLEDVDVALPLGWQRFLQSRRTGPPILWRGSRTFCEGSGRPWNLLPSRRKREGVTRSRGEGPVSNRQRGEIEERARSDSGHIGSPAVVSR